MKFDHLRLHFLVAYSNVVRSLGTRSSAWQYISLLLDEKNILVFVRLHFRSKHLCNFSRVNCAVTVLLEADTSHEDCSLSVTFVISLVFLNETSSEFARLLKYTFKESIFYFVTIIKSGSSNTNHWSSCFVVRSKISADSVPKLRAFSDTDSSTCLTIVEAVDVGQRKPSFRPITSLSPIQVLRSCCDNRFLHIYGASYFHPHNVPSSKQILTHFDEIKRTTCVRMNR